MHGESRKFRQIFLRKKSKSVNKVNRIDTLIGQNTKFTGDLHFTGGLHIDGIVKGNILADLNSGATLSIGVKGRVEGKIRVPYSIVHGTVDGDVYSAKQIEVGNHANISGNIYYQTITMQSGAQVNGSLQHHAEKERLAKIGADNITDFYASHQEQDQSTWKHIVIGA